MTGKALFPPVFQLKIILFHFLLSILEKRRGTSILRLAQHKSQVLVQCHTFLLSLVWQMVEKSRECGSGHRWPRASGTATSWSLDESLAFPTDDPWVGPAGSVPGGDRSGLGQVFGKLQWIELTEV